MGLAASQARLLTITSRLSSVELRQQQISMDKMRLASDQDNVSEKYTNALNNKTLTISNGSEEIAMTYTTLAAQGYSVMRTSDGVVASSAGTSSAIATTTTAASGNSDTSSSTNAISNLEIKKWVGQSAPTTPKAPETRLSQVLTTKPTAETAVVYNTESAKEIDSMLNTADTALNPKTHGITGKNLISAELVYYVKMIEEYPTLIETLQNAQQKAKDNEDDETAQKYAELVKKAQESYAACQSKTKFKNSSQLTEHINARVDELNDISNEMSSIQESLNNKITTKNQTAQAEYEQRVAVAQAEEAEYQQACNQYNRDYANWLTANSSSSTNNAPSAEQTSNASSSFTTISGASLETTTGTTGSSVAASQELAAQLKNPQFLIQGLLSGYLTLMKDGQQVSLSSATDIVESYDKSDDATAEAEYNAQMNKINRKEKTLDMQAKRLDTEYSALTNEYNSIKTIISNHTQKDFSYFS